MEAKTEIRKEIMKNNIKEVYYCPYCYCNVMEKDLTEDYRHKFCGREVIEDDTMGTGCDIPKIIHI